jgi:hypothetical protein
MGTLWSPDTCGCQIEYDNAGTLIAYRKRCPRHTAATYTDVLTENRTKNSEVEKVRAAKALSEGREVKAEEIPWSIDGSGRLTVDGKRR